MTDLIHPWSRLSAPEQVHLVEQGIKPICVTHEEISTNLQRIEVSSSVELEELDGEPVEWTSYVYHPSERRDDAARAAELLALRREWTADENREFGLLMGYERELVEKWVQKYVLGAGKLGEAL